MITLTGPLNPDDFGLEFILKIVCTNFEIAMHTVEHLEEMPGDPVMYTAVDEGKIKLLKRCIADKKLAVQLGTPVMLLYNVSVKFVNELRGNVVELKDDEVVVEFPHAR